MRTPVFFAQLLSVFALLGLPAALRGGEEETPASPGGSSVSDRLKELEERQKILERKYELDKEAQEEKSKSEVTTTAGTDGFIIKSKNGDFKLRIGGLVQADGRFFVDDDEVPLTNVFTMRKVRLVLEGTAFKYFDFFIMPDFGEGTTVLQDAYVGISIWPFARLRVGKFKEPAGLERLQADHSTIFVERAFPTSLAPNRDVGGQVFGDLGGEVFSYAVGIFNGVADNGLSDTDNSDDKDFAGRVFAHPFKKMGVEPLQGLGLGVAGTYGNQSGTIPTYKTSGQNTFFTYTTGTGLTPASPSVKADGTHWRITPQAYYYWKQFGLLGEYIVSAQAIRRDVTGQASTFDEARNKAWQVAGTFVLTGEEASYKGVTPKKPFDPRAGQWGAFELAVRYSELDVDNDVFTRGFASPTASASKAMAWAVGLNWYFNKNFKWIIDFERTEFDGGAANGKDREPENAILTRFQIYF